MSIERLDHIGIVLADLPAAVAFFTEFGLELESEFAAEGSELDRIVGLRGCRTEAAMLRTPDGGTRLELIEYHAPEAPAGDQAAPAHAPGLRHLAFAVTELDELLARLRGHGAELVGEVVRYGDSFRLCYLRGPEGIIIELAERLG